MDQSSFEGLLALSRAAKSIPAAERASAVEGLYATGHWLLSRERYADAADVLRAMTLVAPEDERAWIALGSAHEGAGQLEVAKEIYAAGCTLARPSGRCGVALVRALRQLGERSEAEAVLEQLEDSNQDDDELTSLLAYERRAA